MKIYIAYRYSTPNNVIDILGNIGKAIEAGIEVIKKGHIPFIPHLDCLVAIWSKGSLPIEYYYKAGLEWLKVCDAMLVLDKNDIGNSKGVTVEYQNAQIWKKKIFYSIDEIPKV